MKRHLKLTFYLKIKVILIHFYPLVNQINCNRQLFLIDQKNDN
jgi:hypothetical protein